MKSKHFRPALNLALDSDFGTKSGTRIFLSLDLALKARHGTKSSACGTKFPSLFSQLLKMLWSRKYVTEDHRVIV